jgi:acetyltransferase-like isoleucine patch superfamily enzyme
MVHVIKMLRYPFLSGIYLPFKIYHGAQIRIRKQASVKLAGRVVIGNPDPAKACVSVLKTNVYVGASSFLSIGHSVSIGPGVNIIVKDKAKLSIGNNTYFTSDLHIESVHCIEIGNDCAISWGVTMIDDDHHQVIPEKAGSTAKKIKVGDHVWIGCNVTILKGSEIGDNSIVAAGSVVKGSFPANSMIAGNPAKVVKQPVNWK